MSVTLEIEDGNPWYLSPNVWVVPGDDPEGPPGLPIVGANAYLWARVRNTGNTRVENATVKYYWANPSVGFDRTTANAIGTSFVTLEAGQTGDVLCLTPWQPVYVNQGHECILAEAFHPSLDPLPAVAAFNVPTDRHVAQRNLSVVMASAKGFHFAFEIHNPGRKEKTFAINATQGRIENIRNLLPLLGRNFKLPAKQGKVTRLGLVSAVCPDLEDGGQRSPKIKSLKVKPHGRAGYTLVGNLDGGAALIQVEQLEQERVVGGLSLLIIHTKEERK